MFKNNDRLSITTFPCGLLSVIGVFIILCLILSLIPLYLNNRLVEKSKTTYPVYTVTNVPFTIGSNAGRQIQTDSKSYEPTSAMIKSIAKELNKLCSKINAHCVVTEVTMSSKTNLFLTLKIYFLQRCSTCRKAEKKCVKKILKKGLTLSIYIEYYENCTLNAIILGTTVIALDNDINDNEISRPIQKTPVQQTDICARSLPYPTDCNRTDASGNIMITLLGYTTANVQYCYYFVPSTSATHITVQFVFQSDINNQDRFAIDDVTLNSTVNLIKNGDFQTVLVGASHSSMRGLIGWTGSICENCQAVLRFLPQTNDYRFVAMGNSVILSQTVPINTLGQQFVYRLGFSLEYSCARTCSVMVKLTTTT